MKNLLLLVVLIFSFNLFAKEESSSSGAEWKNAI